MPAELNAIVTQRIELTPELVVIRVVPDGWDLKSFEAGQFAVLGLPVSALRQIPQGSQSANEISHDSAGDTVSSNGKLDKLIKRAYSIASSSQEQSYLEFYIALVSSGELTPRLFALQPGDQIFLSPKFSGLFTLAEVPPDRNIVLISTGTGLAPYISMLRSQLHCDGPQKIAVLHGARHSADLGYYGELRTLDHHCSNMDYIPIISRPKDEIASWNGQVGYIQDLWSKKILQDKWGGEPSPVNAHIFLCGTPGMIDEMTDTLEQIGFVVHSRRNPGNLHVERYW